MDWYEGSKRRQQARKSGGLLWLDHLMNARVLVKDDRGFSFLIGELSVKLFEE